MQLGFPFPKRARASALSNGVMTPKVPRAGRAARRADRGATDRAATPRRPETRGDGEPARAPGCPPSPRRLPSPRRTRAARPGVSLRPGVSATDGRSVARPPRGRSAAVPVARSSPQPPPPPTAAITSQTPVATALPIRGAALAHGRHQQGHHEKDPKPLDGRLPALAALPLHHREPTSGTLPTTMGPRTHLRHGPAHPRLGPRPMPGLTKSAIRSDSARSDEIAVAERDRPDDAPRKELLDQPAA